MNNAQALDAAAFVADKQHRLDQLGSAFNKTPLQLPSQFFPHHQNNNGTASSMSITPIAAPAAAFAFASAAPAAAASGAAPVGFEVENLLPPAICVALSNHYDDMMKKFSTTTVMPGATFLGSDDPTVWHKNGLNHRELYLTSWCSDFIKNTLSPLVEKSALLPSSCCVGLDPNDFMAFVLDHHHHHDQHQQQHHGRNNGTASLAPQVCTPWHIDESVVTFNVCLRLEYGAAADDDDDDVHSKTSNSTPPQGAKLMLASPSADGELLPPAAGNNNSRNVAIATVKPGGALFHLGNVPHRAEHREPHHHHHIRRTSLIFYCLPLRRLSPSSLSLSSSTPTPRFYDQYEFYLHHQRGGGGMGGSDADGAAAARLARPVAFSVPMLPFWCRSLLSSAADRMLMPRQQQQQQQQQGREGKNSTTSNDDDDDGGGNETPPIPPPHHVLSDVDVAGSAKVGPHRRVISSRTARETLEYFQNHPKGKKETKW